MSNSLLDHISVKAPSERFSAKRHEATHITTNEPVYNPIHRRVCSLPSEREDVIAGAFLLDLARRAGVTNAPMPEYGQQLLSEARKTLEWVDTKGNPVSGEKALIDDSTSGGSYIVPSFFDANLIEVPLLTGELLPRVDLTEVPRGSEVDTAKLSAPTLAWGEGDNTEVALFDTASYLSEIQTTIFGCAVALEVGRDFLSDQLGNIGSRLTSLIGQRLACELDKVVATGNGTTQPQGLTVASGLGSVSSDNSVAGPWTLNDCMSLYFSVGKQYRSAIYRPTFVTNDTTYQRWRAIKIDTASPSTDQRPALAPLTELQSYSTLQVPHVVQGDIANGTALFGAMARYRLYRRSGLEIRWVDGGSTLARKNLVLLVCRARFGGKIMDASAFAKITDGQA